MQKSNPRFTCSCRLRKLQKEGASSLCSALGIPPLGGAGRQWRPLSADRAGRRDLGGCVRSHLPIRSALRSRHRRLAPYSRAIRRIAYATACPVQKGRISSALGQRSGLSMALTDSPDGSTKTLGSLLSFRAGTALAWAHNSLSPPSCGYKRDLTEKPRNFGDFTVQRAVGIVAEL